MNTLFTFITLVALVITPIMVCLPSWLGVSDEQDVATPAVESWYDYDFHFGFAQYHADDCRCGRVNADNYSRLLADDGGDEYDEDHFVNSFVIEVTRHTRDEFASRDRFPKHVSKSKEVK
jgi:hypothetical protein